MGMPVISVFIGAGSNAHVLGDTAKQARHYAATIFLAEKHGLDLPANIHRDLDIDSPGDGAQDSSYLYSVESDR